MALATCSGTKLLRTRFNTPRLTRSGVNGSQAFDGSSLNGRAGLWRFSLRGQGSVMTVHASTVALVVLLSASIFSSSANAQTCSCGPDFCTDVPEYKKALTAKKQRLSKDFPARLVGLFDKADRCKACIERSPDGFSLFRRAQDGTITIDSWTEENERIGAAALAAGSLSACRVIITRHAFECCGSGAFSKRADYDKSLDLNTGATLACEK